MQAPQNNKYLLMSCIMHAALLLIFVLGVKFAGPTYVVENSNKHDVISAVVLGDTINSKILPHEKPTQTPKIKPKRRVKKVKLAKARKETKEARKPTVKKTAAKSVVKEKAIGLSVKKRVAKKKSQRKKVARKKATKIKQNKEAVLNKLLADIKSSNEEKLRAKKEIQDSFKDTLRMQSEKSLRQQLLDEEIKLEAKRAQQRQGVVNKYLALINQAVGQNWIFPATSNRKLKSELMVRLAPGGAVIDVTITKSSGDPALDNSARAAVYKSSPLPVPRDPEMFEVFRQFIMVADPKNIIEV